MSVYNIIFAETEIPEIIPVKYRLPEGKITQAQIQTKVAETIEQSGSLQQVKAGQTVALAVGSREINHINLIVKAVVQKFLDIEAKPFIIPAMGSHGGATAIGQQEVLAGYGITEDTMGVPVKATMETVQFENTPSGLHVYLDKYANEADYIIPIGRIKPHTDFRGEIESGLMKMLAVGCGKQQGANVCHSRGIDYISNNIVDLAGVIQKRKSVPFGLGIIEDAFHNTYFVQAVPGNELEKREKELLKIAKSLVTCIPFEKVDVIVMEEIGKDISGAGMDPNVTGRSLMLGVSRPYAERIAVLDLSEKSQHSAAGIGTADVTTQRLFEKTDLEKTYVNGITSHDPLSIKMPPIMPTDRDAIKLALQTCLEADLKQGYRMVMLKNTLHLNSFYISPALLEEAKGNPDITILGEARPLEFDSQGNLPYLS